MNTVTQKEPLALLGTIGSVIAAGIVLLQSFGVPLTDAQADAINQFALIAAPLVIALIGRSLVFSPNTTKDVAESAIKTGEVPPTVK